LSVATPVISDTGTGLIESAEQTMVPVGTSGIEVTFDVIRCHQGHARTDFIQVTQKSGAFRLLRLSRPKHFPSRSAKVARKASRMFGLAV